MIVTHQKPFTIIQVIVLFIRLAQQGTGTSSTTKIPIPLGTGTLGQQKAVKAPLLRKLGLTPHCAGSISYVGAWDSQRVCTGPESS